MTRQNGEAPSLTCSLVNQIWHDALLPNGMNSTTQDHNSRMVSLEESECCGDQFLINCHQKTGLYWVMNGFQSSQVTKDLQGPKYIFLPKMAHWNPAQCITLLYLFHFSLAHSVKVRGNVHYASVHQQTSITWPSIRSSLQRLSVISSFRTVWLGSTSKTLPCKHVPKQPGYCILTADILGIQSL